MYWLIKIFVWNIRRRGLIRYWWTGHSYQFFKGYRLCRKGIWDLEVRDGAPFEGSIFKHCLKRALKGKLHSITNLCRIKVWNNLFRLLAIMKEENEDDKI